MERFLDNTGNIVDRYGNILEYAPQQQEELYYDSKGDIVDRYGNFVRHGNNNGNNAVPRADMSNFANGRGTQHTMGRPNTTYATNGNTSLNVNNNNIKRSRGAAVPAAAVNTGIKNILQPHEEEKKVKLVYIRKNEYEPLHLPNYKLIKVPLGDKYYDYEITKDDKMEKKVHEALYDPTVSMSVTSIDEVELYKKNEYLMINDVLKNTLDNIEFQMFEEECKDCNIFYNTLTIQLEYVSKDTNDKISDLYSEIITEAKDMCEVSDNLLFLVNKSSSINDKTLSVINDLLTRRINYVLAFNVKSNISLDSLADTQELYDLLNNPKQVSESNKNKHLNALMELHELLKHEVRELKEYDKEALELVTGFIGDKVIPTLIPSLVNVCFSNSVSLSHELTISKIGNIRTVDNSLTPVLGKLINELDNEKMFNKTAMVVLSCQGKMYKIYRSTITKKYNVVRILNYLDI